MALRHKAWLIGALLLAGIFPAARAADKPAAPEAKNAKEVLVYPLASEGSIMHWLGISPLKYNVAYIGDCMSYDPFRADGQNELTIRPAAGDKVQEARWKKMHYSGSITGPTMCELFQVAGHGFDFALTPSAVYIYSPEARPNAVFSGSADDGLKVILNGKKLWSNQIQRSPTYDSDQVAAPLQKGWNTLICVVDQAIGGHLLCARFLDADKPIMDLQLALDPPAPDAVRHPAEEYNKQAAEMMRTADDFRGADKYQDAVAAYDRVLASFPLADVAPRAAYAKANVQYRIDDPAKSLNKAADSVASLKALLDRYPQDPLAEYALLDLGKISATALKDIPAAEATYRRFETEYPQSILAANAMVETAKLMAETKRYEDSLLTYRTAIKKYPESDQVMVANIGIADTYRLSGEAEKANKQYIAARAMAQDWHDNKYGVDVGKQAWLEGILENLRTQIKE